MSSARVLGLMSPLELLTRFDGIELVVDPWLEGAARRWHPVDERTIAVAPSLMRELRCLVPLRITERKDPTP